MLVGAFTWLAPEVPADAPQLEESEEAPLPELWDEDDVWGEIQAQRDAEAEEKERQEERGESRSVEGQPEGAEVEEGGEERKDEERVDPKIVVTRLCVPIQSKRQQDVF